MLIFMWVFLEFKLKKSVCLVAFLEILAKRLWDKKTFFGMILWFLFGYNFTNLHFLRIANASRSCPT